MILIKLYILIFTDSACVQMRVNDFPFAIFLEFSKFSVLKGKTRAQPPSPAPAPACNQKN